PGTGSPGRRLRTIFRPGLHKLRSGRHTGRVALIRRLRRLSVLGMSMCVALIGVACTTISPERPHPVEQQTLRVAARASIDVVPLRLGVRRGFFREEGLQLRFVKQPTDAGVPRAVIDGTADVGLVSNYLMLRRAA